MPKTITYADVREALEAILEELEPAEILDLPGVFDVLSEHFKVEILGRAQGRETSDAE